MPRVPYQEDNVPVPFNIFRALGHAPSVTKGFSSMGSRLLNETELDTHIRELVINAISLKLDAPYEWSHHAKWLLDVGGTTDELEALRSGDLDALGPLERACVEYAYKVEDATVTDSDVDELRRGGLSDRRVEAEARRRGAGIGRLQGGRWTNRLARRGGHVLLAARRGEELERVRAAVEAEGGQASTYVVDLTDGEAIDALVARLLDEYGAVDYLVNNAGKSIRRSLELTHDRFSRLSSESEERAGRHEASIMHDFERMMAVNYFGPVRLTMGLLPAMRAQRFGHVVNIVTWGNQIRAPKFAAYIAAKSALDVFGRILGREAFFDNVTCTNMRVAIVRTPMIAPTASYDGRGESAEECAERVVKALEDRPITVNGAFGSFYEIFNLAAPRLADLAMAIAHERSPDSAAARGVAQQESAPAR